METKTNYMNKNTNEGLLENKPRKKYTVDKVKKADSDKKYRLKNMETLKIRSKELRELPENKAKIVAHNAKNRKQINDSHRAYIANRTAENPLFLQARQLRAHISRTFQRALNGEGNIDRYHDILGCTIRHWFDYIISQFTDGMTLENRDSFQLDHKAPISCAISEEELIRLHHWTNYQPLTRSENARKGKVINPSIKAKVLNLQGRKLTKPTSSIRGVQFYTEKTI